MPKPFSPPGPATANMRFNILAAVLFIITSGLSVMFLRERLLMNAHNTGTTVVASLAGEEQNTLSLYDFLLVMGTKHLDELEGNAAGEKAASWLQDYFGQIREVVGNGVIDPYAVINGRIVAANPWEGDAAYDITGAEWYRKTLAAGGRTVFSDVYPDVITGRPIITVAKKCAGSANVLAFDIFPDKIFMSDALANLPPGSSYYLCDKSGSLIYTRTILRKPHSELQAYVKSILEKIENGYISSYDSYIYDLNNRRRGVYYTRMQNGWHAVVTIPYSTMLSEFNKFTIWISLSFILFLSYIIFTTWHSYRANRRDIRTSETLQILGNIYYGLYRVNYEDGTYEMIKGTAFARSCLKKTGPYAALMQVLEKTLKEDTRREFAESFSLRNIKQLVRRHVHDFGGDFLRLDNDEFRWANIRILYDETMLNNEVILCFRNVEVEKREQLEQKQLLEEALNSARKNEKSRKAFFSSMSHDMRTPLNAIISSLSLAREHLHQPEKLAAYVEKMDTSCRHLLHLINDILEMSRLESGKFTFHLQEFDLKKCMEDITSVFHTVSEKENKTFTVSFDIQDHVIVGDSFRLTQIVNNLLSNAFKFSREGDSISVSVKQFTSQKHSRFEFTVADTGAGMSEEFLGRIFEPYSRETRFGAKKVMGTGLGMSIVRSIVTQMSGRITVKSTLGKGSVFTVSLPFEVVRGAAAPAVEEQKPMPSDGNLEGMRILLAEDNVINMEIASEILTRKGINVVPAWNGREAVEIFQTSRPFTFDAILMDMQMPEMDGCEAARRIRSLERRDARQIPIIAATANAFAEDIARTEEAGMDAHISKPMDYDILCRTLMRLIPAARDSAAASRAPAQNDAKPE